MKKGINNNRKSILSTGFFIAILLSALVFSQDVLAKTTQSVDFKQITDTIKNKKASLPVVEANKVMVELSDLQKIAQYPGGLEKFYAKINAKFSNSEMDYEGFAKINVSFVIEKDGSMSAITVNDQTMSNSMKKSIERVLQSIKTKWSPAIIKDQPVRTEYELPLVFND
jgi:protein TonB